MKATENGSKQPSQKTLKRLFGEAGNKCAFPKCLSPIIDGETVAGEVCHIRAANPGGPRYDAEQTNEQRHSYENLILLCAAHHKVIDDDDEAYSVDRLQKMKKAHTEATSPQSDDKADADAVLFISAPVTSIQQLGGITARDVTIHHNYGAQTRGSAPAGYDGFPAQPKDGKARFRAAGEALGMRNYNAPPYTKLVPTEISLLGGPAVWLRLLPQQASMPPFSSHDLKQAGDSIGCFCPLTLTQAYSLMADDGYGICSLLEGSSTRSVVFAFETGEVWAVDSYLLDSGYTSDAGGPAQILFPHIAEELIKCLQGIVLFLTTLGIPKPYRWIAGLEGVKNRRLQYSSYNSFMTDIGMCLSDVVTLAGDYDGTKGAKDALLPFFDHLFRKCGKKQVPEDVLSLL